MVALKRRALQIRSEDLLELQNLDLAGGCYPPSCTVRTKALPVIGSGVFGPALFSSDKMMIFSELSTKLGCTHESSTTICKRVELN
jgi:hypothetical protein